MSDRTIGDAVRQYIVDEILEGDGQDLDGATPLLEWGILNSMEMVRLLGFLRRDFDVDISPEEVTPAHFRSIDEIAALVRARKASQKP